MRKTITIALALFCGLLLFGCVQQTINDTSTGEISSATPEHTYQDGIYTASATYFNEDGYLSAMQLTVKEGIITNVDFDYFDQNGDRYSEQSDEENVETIQTFKTERKTLNSSLLEQQDASGIADDDSLSELYLIFAESLITAAQNGDTSAQMLAIDQTYTASEPIVLADELTVSLCVNYQADTLESIEFFITDADGTDLSRLTQNETVFSELYGLDYENAVSKLTAIPDDQTQLTKETDESFPQLYEIYNRLAQTIEALHISAGTNPAQLFSSSK